MARTEAIWENLFRVTDGIRSRHLRSEEGTPANPILNLTISQGRMFHQVLELRAAYPEGVSLSRLADRAGVSPAAASEMVDVLVRKEVLVREVSPEDRRAIRIRLSPESCRRIERAGILADKIWRGISADFSREELDLLNKLLRRLVAQLDASEALAEK